MCDDELLWKSSVGETDAGSDGSCVLPPPKKRQKQENNSTATSMKFKGVVMQQNGHWGAQIYANHQRIWLGTFPSEHEAAMAYDSAATKLRSADLSHRNFPQTDLTLEEPEFQALYTTDDIVNMIKDRSYDVKFAAYLRSKSVHKDGSMGPDQNLGNDDVHGSGIIYQQLFQKELTPSDVGKLNRLVVPKKHAVKYFPAVVDRDDKDPDDVQLSFLDSNLKAWNFRYCYWKSSQSFVFTRGWNRFVKDKGLRPKDVLSFCKCGLRDEFSQTRVFFMIKVTRPTNQHPSQPQINSMIMDVGRLGCIGDMNRRNKAMTDEGVHVGEEGEADGGEEAEKAVVTATPKTDNKGVRLFGVFIN